MGMSDIYLDKVVINIGIGPEESGAEGAKALIKKLSGHEAAPTFSKKRDPELKLRKGQVIGAMATLRGADAESMLKRALDANGNLIRSSSISNNSLSFGVKEYIYFSGVKYDPKIGILGMNINAAFARKGRRIELRRRASSKMGKKHRIIDKEAILSYLNKYNVKIEE